jgi:hypothetical protein
MTASSPAVQVPLIELLSKVPLTARLVIEDGPYSTSYIPVGRYCHEAASALATPAPPVAPAGNCGHRPPCEECAKYPAEPVKEADVSAIRDAALEAAAKACEDLRKGWAAKNLGDMREFDAGYCCSADKCAAAIRVLRGGTP